jgi:hypothetical protein
MVVSPVLARYVTRYSGLMLFGSRSMMRQYSRLAGTTQASLFDASCPKPNPVAASGGVEIHVFRAARPYFGFADHMK